MTTKQSLFLLAFPVLAACNNQTAVNSKDNKTDTTQIVHVTDKEPIGEGHDMEQIKAQDTLFEDGSKPSSWYDAGFNDPVAFKQFIIQFKKWVRTDNTSEIAAHIRFPLKKVKTADEFKKQYAQIFTQQHKDAVAKQRLDRIFRNVDGAMLGDGLIWFVPSDKKYSIIAINN
jgi:hypothetical protein